MLAAVVGIAVDRRRARYIGDEDGDVSIFKLAKELEVVGEINMGNAVYSTPIVANGVLYISEQELSVCDRRQGDRQ